MEKYILELITENNRVIIPNFGAFIISKEHGLSILFNNFLSFNDGLLVNYIAEKKGIDTIVATDEVFNYVDNLKKDLDEKGEYSIDKLGTFKKDENGILRFQQAEDFAELFEKKEETTDEESVEKQEQETALLDIDDEISPVPEEEKTQESSTEEEKGTEPLLSIDTETEAEKDEEKNKTADTVSAKENINTDNKPTEKPEETKRSSSYYAEKVIQEKRRRDMITFIVIAAVILIGLAIYFLFFTNNDEKKKETKPTKTIVKPVVKEPIKKDTVAVEIKKPEVKAEPVATPPLAKKGEIHIIVGGFKIEDNAIKMVEKLRKSGHNKAQMITKGKMFLVSIDSDVSYRKMEEKQQILLEKEQMGSWMYKVK
ncbi:hypothetical protein E9993_03225 [Labilibacter sediminis]|nr:hypothetical protein E9993_03225 [Labilibacter sediminis]